MRHVLTGLDRLLRDGPRLARLPSPARVGLLAHAASVDARARPAPLALQRDDRFELAILFAPEHGLWGHEQDMESVASTTDPWTALRVISLYGSQSASLRPATRDLAGLDAILVDLQDVGSRYYTYIYTLSFVMEAARDAGVPVVVLDRPNPLGGERVEGPVLDAGLESFVGLYPLPVRHGMTVAELACWFNLAHGIGCDLRPVEMDGWARTMSFEATGLPWVPPSPNMPTTRTVAVYPGGCLIEGTTLSEGRGTTTPFELVGAPWLDAPSLASRLAEPGLPDVEFRPASFRPMFQKHAARACTGVQVIPNGPRFRPFETYLALIAAAREQDPASFAWRDEAYEFVRDRLAIDLLLGRHGLRQMLEAGAGLDEMRRSWTDGTEAFIETRQPYLLYRS